MQRQRLLAALCVLAAAAFCGFELQTHIPTGIVGLTKRTDPAGIGCVCHNLDPSPEITRVWISGPDSVSAGTVATFTISVSRDSSHAAGFNVAAKHGALIATDTVFTHLLPAGDDTLELTHTQPRPAEGRDTVTWMFDYRAPLGQGDMDTIYAVGNSVNFDGVANEFDHWNFGENFPVRIVPATGVRDQPLARTFRLLQNFPNPFNPSTTVRYEVTANVQVTLAVYDVAGRLVAHLFKGTSSPGVHEVRFDALSGGRPLSSGIYFVRLEVPGSSVVRKMMLLR